MKTINIKKTIIVAALLSTCVSAFAYFTPSPIHICLRQANSVKYLWNIQEQLSWPGHGGINSGWLSNTGTYTCMSPYSWSGGQDFNMFAYSYKVLDSYTYYHYCTGHLTTKLGIKSATIDTAYYTAYNDSNSNQKYGIIQCKLDKEIPVGGRAIT